MEHYAAMRVMGKTWIGTVCSIAVAFYIIWYKAAHLFLTHTIPVLNADRPEVEQNGIFWHMGNIRTLLKINKMYVVLQSP